MKKMIALLLATVLALSLCSCGGDKTPEPAVSVTLDDVTKALQTVDPSFAFDESDKPMFSMIAAEDGHMGYLNGSSPVKIYEYKDEAAYKKAVEDFPMIKDWPKAGLFVLECSNEDVRAAFNSLIK